MKAGLSYERMPEAFSTASAVLSAHPAISVFALYIRGDELIASLCNCLHIAGSVHTDFSVTSSGRELFTNRRNLSELHIGLLA
jgi:hypothetical protein